MSRFVKVKRVVIFLFVITVCGLVCIKVYKISKIKALKNIVLLGKAASGKGTYGSMLAKEYNLYHMSAGQILRDCTQNVKCKNNKIVKEYIDAGKLLPSDIIYDILFNDINKKVLCFKCKYNGVVFDGFPRNVETISFFDKYDVKINKVINIDITDEEAIKRIQNRKDGRTDDSDMNAIKKRLEVYQLDTKKVLNIFEERGVLVNVNGIGSKSDIYKKIKEIIFALFEITT